MLFTPAFPTRIHHDAALAIQDFFSGNRRTDTVLIVNSCARGQAVPESDLDFAILVTPDTSKATIGEMEADWAQFSAQQPALLAYRDYGPFAHLHLDIIEGIYTPTILEVGVASDYFEIEIGNQICYSAPMGPAGSYFRALQDKWLPYYDEELRRQRFAMCKAACTYDLNHIPLFAARGLYFQAFDILCKAFQEYLQTLFIARKAYPIAYNKWIKEQIANWLQLPDLYKRLPAILSVSNIESDEINEKASLLRALLDELQIQH